MYIYLRFGMSSPFLKPLRLHCRLRLTTHWRNLYKGTLGLRDPVFRGGMLEFYFINSCFFGFVSVLWFKTLSGPSTNFLRKAWSMSLILTNNVWMQLKCAVAPCRGLAVFWSIFSRKQHENCWEPWSYTRVTLMNSIRSLVLWGLLLTWALLWPCRPNKMRTCVRLTKRWDAGWARSIMEHP